MKKLVALGLSLALAFSLVACGGGDSSSEAENSESARPVEQAYKLGLGVVVSNGSSSSYSEEADKGNAQIDTTIMAVSFDNEGKVISASLDVAQQKGTITGEGAIADPDSIDLRTKVEKGDDYGMKDSSGIGKEVYEQYAAFTDWMVGKTVEEIVSTPVTERDEEHDQVPADEELSAGVTIDIGSMLEAVQKASENTVDLAAAPAKTGLGVNVSATPTDATADKNGSLQIDTTIAALALDADGKVLGSILDVAQNKVEFDTAGQLAENFDARTKVEKKEDYGMKGASGIGKELYEQLAAFEDWMLGKTTDEIVNTETVAGEEEGSLVAADEELKAGVTISVGAYLDAIGKARTNAK